MNISRILYYLVNFIFTIVGLILGLRILFRFLSANPQTPFVGWIYDSSTSLLAPFSGIFPSPSFEGFVIDFPAFFALLIYALIGYLIIEIVEVISVRSTQRLKNKK